MTSRDTVFISHGNPEDNEIAGWLAARLTGAGYKVWLDLWHDKGHPTWDEIEQVIRTQTIRFIPLVSKQSVRKSGFKDEVHAASGQARELNDSGFTIPIRLDSISFQSEVPIQLARLNFIDGYSSGWDGILADLLVQLQRDAVRMQTVPSTALYENWMQRRSAAERLVSKKPERLLSNWFEIETLPKNINFYHSQSLRSSWDMAAEALKFPKKLENGILCSFAPIDDVRFGLPLGVSVKLLKRMGTEEFLKGSDKAPLFATWQEASRAMVDLVRQGFGGLAIYRGLQEHRLSNRNCWFPKNSTQGDERIRFTAGDFSGSRKLCGRHKEFYWHYAASIDVTLTPPKRITASGHVLFSANGEVILDDVKVGAKLRRQAVRSKRNAWWRDVLLAYFSHLSLGHPTLSLPMGGNETIEVARAPIAFESPKRLEFDGDHSNVEGPIDEIESEDDEYFDEDFAPDSDESENDD